MNTDQIVDSIIEGERGVSGDRERSLAARMWRQSLKQAVMNINGIAFAVRSEALAVRGKDSAVQSALGGVERKLSVATKQIESALADLLRLG